MNLTSLTYFMEFKRKGKTYILLLRVRLKLGSTRLQNEGMTTTLGLISCHTVNLTR